MHISYILILVFNNSCLFTVFFCAYFLRLLNRSRCNTSNFPSSGINKVFLILNLKTLYDYIQKEISFIHPVQGDILAFESSEKKYIQKKKNSESQYNCRNRNFKK